MVQEIFQGLGVMTMITFVVMVCVVMAMVVDCVSGWRKAKLRGDEHTSYAFSRSLTKFLIYEGIVLIAYCMDFMLHFAWWQFMSGGYVVPCTAILAGIVLCLVEAWSVKEKADKKQRKQIENAAALIAKVLDKETVMEFLRAQMKDKNDVASIVAPVDGETQLRRTELVSDDF